MALCGHWTSLRLCVPYCNPEPQGQGRNGVQPCPTEVDCLQGWLPQLRAGLEQMGEKLGDKPRGGI